MSVDSRELLKRLFHETSLPATLEQIRRNGGFSLDPIVDSLLKAGVDDGDVCKDGDTYYPAPHLLAEWIAEAQESVREEQEHLDHLLRQQQALTARAVSKT